MLAGMLSSTGVDFQHAITRPKVSGTSARRVRHPNVLPSRATDMPTANNGSVALIIYVTATEPWLILAAVKYAPKKFAKPTSAIKGPPAIIEAYNRFSWNPSPISAINTPHANCRSASSTGDTVGFMFIACLANNEYPVETPYLRFKSDH